VNKWISVKDALPPIGRKVLITFNDNGGSIVDAAWLCSNFEWDVENWLVSNDLITHWMPLPKPPEMTYE